VNRRRAVLLAVAVSITTGAALLAFQLTRSSTAGGRHVPPTVDAAGLVERSGVRVIRVAVTGDGGLVDLRYQVVDADKAQLVHDLPPLLIDEGTGGVVMRPWMGHMHMNAPKQGISYFVLFENSGDLIRPGKRVTVQLGDARIAHVRVR
jgi:hypothetical protein